MKQISIALLLVLTTAFFSCKKDNKDTKPVFVTEGTYVGKIGSGVQIPNGHFSIQLKSGGLLDRINESGTVSATGTWQRNGSAFTAHYETSNGVKVDLTGTITESQKRIQGNWENNNGVSGSFYATKE